MGLPAQEIGINLAGAEHTCGEAPSCCPVAMVPVPHLAPRFRDTPSAGDPINADPKKESLYKFWEFERHLLLYKCASVINLTA